MTYPVDSIDFLLLVSCHDYYIYVTAKAVKTVLITTYIKVVLSDYNRRLDNREHLVNYIIYSV